MKLKNKIDYIISYLDLSFPNAHCELNYFNDYSFLIAVMLSSQTTDKKVNSVANILFNKYKDLKAISSANLIDLEKILFPLGLYKNKSKNLKNLAYILVTKYNEKVPTNFDELILLPGIGRKTANVFLGEIYHQKTFPVDTHIKRVSFRLGLTKHDDANKVEEDLKKLFPPDRWNKLHHQLIFFGRNICKSQNPDCKSCGFCSICNYIKSSKIDK